MGMLAEAKISMGYITNHVVATQKIWGVVEAFFGDGLEGSPLKCIRESTQMKPGLADPISLQYL